METCLKSLKKDVIGLKRKPRELIDPVWENWLEEKPEYLEIFSFKRIKELMEEDQEKNNWYNHKLPTRFMINNRKKKFKSSNI